jgi:hypothetical protein
MAKFTNENGKLLIDGHEVIKGWESFSGWYWFAMEKIQTQDSAMGDGSVIHGDTIWYGLVQGFEEEWGDFSEGELKRIKSVWPIKEIDLPYAGRRS